VEKQAPAHRTSDGWIKEHRVAATTEERVLEVTHFTERLFTFRTTRSQAFRFQAGQFTMIGLPESAGHPKLLRAYSMASAVFDEHLDFFSIIVDDGPLTSRLRHLKPGDEVLVGTRATGTLTIGQLLPGENLWLLSTGTGLAPFLSIIQDPETYERFSRVIVAHGTRNAQDLVYSDYIENGIKEHELVGEAAREQLLYFPTVTRESFKHQGRISTHLQEGTLEREFGLPPHHPSRDRVMLCGSVAMLNDLTSILESRGFEHGSAGEPATFLTERAFAPS
jgi:ferredoxin--NADP+ reductase